MNKHPLAGMGWGQRIATMALLLLVLIAAVSCMGRSSESSQHKSSEFTSQSYSTDASGTSSPTDSSGSDASSNSQAKSSSGSSSGSASSEGVSATPRASDGMDVIALGDLPKQGRDTVALIDQGGPYPYSRDGVVFGNRERVLPKHPRGWYHEYTVKTPGESDRGARRIVQGKDGTLYYSDDHYQSFRRVTR